MRYNIVVPGLEVPLFPTLPRAYIEAKLNYIYTPTMNEWLVTLFTIALGAAIFMLGMTLLPVTKVQTLSGKRTGGAISEP